jgi:hypothetical protein
MDETPAGDTAYRDFSVSWKEADPDTPIFKEAKSEYARLLSGADDDKRLAK